MPVSFTKAAIMQSVGALLGTLIRFGLISVTLSLTLYLVAWTTIQVQGYTGNTPFLINSTAQWFPSVPGVNYAPPQDLPQNLTIYGFLKVFDPQEYLSQYPIFKYLGYVQVMWYVLLIPIFFGGAVYFIILSQGNGMSTQQIVDYFSDVAWPTLEGTGIFIGVWLIMGGVILAGASMYPSDFVAAGIGGLIKLGAIKFWEVTQTVFGTIYPYLPIPVEIGAFMYLLKEVHTGWVGNQW